MERIKKYLERPQVWGFFVAVAVMAVLSLAFFYPDNFEGNTLKQPDMQQGIANGHESTLYEEATGEKALWTNSLFGGMPTFQISPSYPSNALFTWLNSVYGLGLPAPSNLLFMMMFGFLILLYAMRMRWYYALIGAVAWGFSSYFIIIIGAGHIWKFLALTYVPPTLAGFILLYRGRRVLGAALMALFGMLQLNANHPQVTYYFALLGAILAIAYLVDAIRRGIFRKWIVATAIAVGAVALAVGANAPSLYNTYEYAKETKRSQSELTPLAASGEAAAPADRPTGGLAKSEILGWSYGRSEMLSLFIPNIKGGASARPEGGRMVPMTLDRLDDAADIINRAPIAQYLTQYFNNSEGTNGPVYVGIIVIALFILGCFIIRGPLKWGLLAGTVVSALLALGYNFETLSDAMIYHFPMYNKFRAVESILVVAEFTIPFLAVLALARLLEDGKEKIARYRKPLLWAFGVPAVICAAGIVWPRVFGGVITDNDRYTSQQIQNQIISMCRQQGASDAQTQQMTYAYSLANPDNVEAVESLRFGMVRTDSLRSLLFLLLASGMLFLYMSGRLSYGIAVGGVGVLIMADLYGVDKRYVSTTSFTAADSGAATAAFVPDNIDSAILAEGDTHARVMDIPGFNSPDRSYFHNMVGGYHAAKLNRYEDLIQRKLMPVLQYGYFPDDPDLDDPEIAEIAVPLRNGYAVLDMLNARYVITGDDQAPVVRNSRALGNAWFVDSIVWVDNADDEMAMLDVRRLDLSHQAVADRRFASVLPASPAPIDSADYIELTEYTPNRLTYRLGSRNGGVAVFSEVYFPWGWHATVDGVSTPLARVNYVLRALAVPDGEHTVVMSFSPDSIRTSSGIAYACVTLIYLLMCAALFLEFTRCRPR